MVEFELVTFAARLARRKMRIRTMSIIPKLFLGFQVGVEYCATCQAALYIETHSLMHQSEFHTMLASLCHELQIKEVAY